MKIPVPEALFDKVTGLRLATLLKKEILAQVFSCEFCEISKNTLFTEHLWASTSVLRKNLSIFAFYHERLLLDHRIFCGYLKLFP